METITEVLITDDAFNALTQAVAQARMDGHRELGGSLLAHEQDGSVLIAYALPTGPKADRGTGHILTDAEFQNAAIQRVLRHQPRLRWVGDWHIHPGHLPELSSVDRRTARAILLDDGAQREHLVLLLGTASPRGAPMVVGFVARLTRHGTVSIAKAPITRVAGDGKDVLARLGRPLPPLAALLDGAPAEDVEITLHDGDRFEDVATIRLIEDDLAEIRRALDAEATLWRDDDLLTAVIRRGASEAFVVFPPEYPLGAPQVFAAASDGDALAPIALPFGWSTLHRLADPVAEALAPPAAACTGGHTTASRTARAAQWACALFAFFGLHRIGRMLAARSVEVAS